VLLRTARATAALLLVAAVAALAADSADAASTRPAAAPTASAPSHQVMATAGEHPHAQRVRLLRRRHHLVRRDLM
jgi:hypothetical protein